MAVLYASGPSMTRYRLRSDAIWRDADGEVLAVQGDMENYVSVNASGTLLWKALVDGASREQLVQCLVTEFSIERSRAAADVEVFLTELESNGFLER